MHVYIFYLYPILQRFDFIYTAYKNMKHLKNGGKEDG